MNKLFKKYGHGLFGLYLFIYLPWFFWLEGMKDVVYNEIHCFLDDLIPFCEIFIIPYILWFFYMIATCIFMYFKAERGEFLRFAIALTGGMSIAMIICQIYPSCVNLRPVEFPHNNVFTKLIGMLYAIDTSTNVFPSIHVLNSIIACVALERNTFFRRSNLLRLGNILLCILICLSTLFLKQHSVLDLIGGALLYVILYLLLYVPDWKIFKSREILIP